MWSSSISFNPTIMAKKTLHGKPQQEHKALGIKSRLESLLQKLLDSIEVGPAFDVIKGIVPFNIVYLLFLFFAFVIAFLIQYAEKVIDDNVLIWVVRVVGWLILSVDVFVIVRGLWKSVTQQLFKP